jgi:hypothetical protein
MYVLKERFVFNPVKFLSKYDLSAGSFTSHMALNASLVQNKLAQFETIFNNFEVMSGHFFMYLLLQLFIHSLRYSVTYLCI